LKNEKPGPWVAIRDPRHQKVRGRASLDPANLMMTGSDHVVRGKGRDYADVSPVARFIVGSGKQDIDVKVDVVPRASMARLRCIRTI
jgi:transglutaminase-like putative cysteine protease